MFLCTSSCHDIQKASNEKIQILALHHYHYLKVLNVHFNLV